MNDTATPTRDELDILVSKIEKLWRQANNSGATEAERATFEAKALSLMERYRIDAAMLNVTGEDPLGDYCYGPITGRYGQTHIMLIGSVAHAYGCRTWYQHYGMNYTVYVFGFKSDAEKVIRLSKMLLADAMAQAAKHKTGHIGDTFNWRRMFILGYASTVADRFRQAAKIAQDDAVIDTGDEEGVKSAALVLVEREKVVADAYRSKNLARGSGPKLSGGGGYSAGTEAGRRADLSGGSNRVGSGQRALSA